MYWYCVHYYISAAREFFPYHDRHIVCLLRMCVVVEMLSFLSGPSLSLLSLDP